MLKVFRFFCFLFLFLLVFSFLYICLLCCFSGCRIKCTGEANVVPTGGDFPVVYVMQHLKGLCILEQSQLPLNRISFLLFYVPNPKVHWAWISERCGPIRRLFWLSQIVVPENILKLIVLKKKKKKERKFSKDKAGTNNYGRNVCGGSLEMLRFLYFPS